MEVLTHSRLKTLKQCPWKHNLRYRYGVTPADPGDTLRFGSLIHHGLDVAAKTSETEGIATALKIHQDKNMPEPHADQSEWDKFWVMFNRISATLHSYFWRWRKADAESKVIASELEFTVPIYNPDTGKKSRKFKYSGKIDKIVQLPSGDLAIREHKTTSDDISPESNYWKRLRLDSQISGYFLGAQSLGYDVKFVQYDVIRKPGIGPKWLTQAETRNLLDNGVYQTKLAQGEEPSIIGEGYEIEYEWLEEVMPLPSKVFVDEEEVHISWGKQDIAIRETHKMFGHRLFQYMAAFHESYYARRDIPRNGNDIEDFQAELWVQAKILSEREKQGAWEHNDNQCVGFGVCPYLDLCTEGYDPDVDPLPEKYITRGIHEELTLAQ